jgi:hypothetical protein
LGFFLPGKMKNSVYIIVLFLLLPLFAQDGVNTLRVARIKYDGGGDWYGNKTTFINLLEKIRSETGIMTQYREETVELTESSLFNFPLLYIAGHGNIRFSDEEAAQLRTYLLSGGFLFADDDYGMDAGFRREMKKVFPELNFVELPFSHPIYRQYYDFPSGLPKIHEHDGGPPAGYGLIQDGRLLVFYSFNTDISDGCEDAEIHEDPPEKRESALRMGMNILLYGFMN